MPQARRRSRRNVVDFVDDGRTRTEAPVLPLDDGRVGRRRACRALPYRSFQTVSRTVGTGSARWPDPRLRLWSRPINQASRGGDAHAPLTRRRTMTEIREGMNVLSADGERLGRIIRIEGDSLLIEKGFFFHKDYACSVNNVREVRGDDVILSLSKIQLETAIGGATEQATDETRPSTGVRQDVR